MISTLSRLSDWLEEVNRKLSRKKITADEKKRLEEEKKKIEEKIFYQIANEITI